jgi:hypothetical protein
MSEIGIIQVRNVNIYISVFINNFVILNEIFCNTYIISLRWKFIN